MDAQVHRRERERMQAEERTGERVEEVAQHERAERARRAELVHAEVDDEHEEEVRRQARGNRARGKTAVCSSIDAMPAMAMAADRRTIRYLAPGLAGCSSPRSAGGTAGRTGPRVTSTSSSRSTSTAGSTCAYWKRPCPCLSTAEMCPTGSPGGKMPSSPELTTRSPDLEVLRALDELEPAPAVDGAFDDAAPARALHDGVDAAVVVGHQQHARGVRARQEDLSDDAAGREHRGALRDAGRGRPGRW